METARMDVEDGDDAGVAEEKVAVCIQHILPKPLILSCVWRNINTIISWQNGIEILQWLDLPVMFRCAAFCFFGMG